jgi:hypothetical protein
LELAVDKEDEEKGDDSGLDSCISRIVGQENGEYVEVEDAEDEEGEDDDDEEKGRTTTTT